ncbi:MAG: 30S ribosomal protein S6 [candidate division WWE3 bacterium]|nr:30S ribosomal protein S6 [candidate division WWE3 bacterium]
MNYELALILKGIDSIVPVRKLLEKAKVKIVKEDDMGKRRLAYKINDLTDGYYMFWTVSGDNKTVIELSKNFKLNADVVRFLFTKSS